MGSWHVHGSGHVRVPADWRHQLNQIVPGQNAILVRKRCPGQIEPTGEANPD
jgi:hypothetical protein